MIKGIKKIATFCTVILLWVGLAACDPANYYYFYDELKDNVIGVELINYHNSNAKELFEKRNKQGFYEGYSTNYIPVKFFSQKCIENEIFNLKVLKIEGFSAIMQEI